jgi:hypothetical protein
MSEEYTTLDEEIDFDISLNDNTPSNSDKPYELSSNTKENPYYDNIIKRIEDKLSKIANDGGYEFLIYDIVISIPEKHHFKNINEVKEYITPGNFEEHKVLMDYEPSKVLQDINNQKAELRLLELLKQK